MYCVIMGDIINSKEMDDETIKAVTTAAKNIFDIINTDYYKYIVAPFGIVRGDAFEGVLLSPVLAPDIVQKVIKAFYKVKETKVRISVSVDNLSIVSSDRNESNGPAFHKAVEVIKNLKKIKSNHWFQVSFFSNSTFQPIIERRFLLLSGITQKWTDEQRQIVWAMQDYFGSDYFGAVFFASEKTEFAVSVIKKQLTAANYEEYKSIWDDIKRHFAEAEDETISGRTAEKSYTVYFSAAMRKTDRRLFEEAIPLYKRALKLAKNDFGESSTRLAVIYVGLAWVLQEKGDLSKAKYYINNAFKLQEHMPKSGIEYADTLGVSAAIDRKDRKYESSKKNYLKAIEIAENTAGINHPILSSFYSNIAGVYRYKGDYEKALSYHFKSLEVFRPDMETIVEKAVKYKNISFCYYCMKDYTNAIEYCEKARDIFYEVLLPNHEYLIDTNKLLEDYIEVMEEQENEN